MKTLIVLFFCLPIFCFGQDFNSKLITRSSGVHSNILLDVHSDSHYARFAKLMLGSQVGIEEHTKIPDSIKNFSIIVGESAYLISDSSKWVVLDSSATLRLFLSTMVILKQNAEQKYKQSLQLSAARELLSFINFDGSVSKKNRGKFQRARDFYIKLNSENK